MRVKFLRNKQKELILNFKKEKGYGWSAYANFLGISTASLLSWKNEELLIPLSAYLKLDPTKRYEKYIEEIREDNWGQVIAGKKSKGNTKEIKTPSFNKRLAEFTGIMLGDGNIFSYRKRTKERTISVHEVSICGNLKDETEYLKEFVLPLCKELFGIKPRIKNHEKNNEILIVMSSVRLVEFLSSLGLVPGNKIQNQLAIPEWIFANKEYLKSCIRGLIDTDGTIYELKPHWPGLFQISFKNNNPILLNNVQKALKELGFKVSNISDNRLYITKASEIRKYIKEIGFNNKKHLLRAARSSSGQTL